MYVVWEGIYCVDSPTFASFPGSPTHTHAHVKFDVKGESLAFTMYIMGEMP